MRTLVIGDIHGGYKGLEQLLKRAQVNQRDKLVFVGDYVDGWSESAQVISRLIDLSKTNSCIFIKGNHDVWCETWLRSGKKEKVWVDHGGDETLNSYQGFTRNEKLIHLRFFENLKLYHISNKNQLFIHAGFTSKKGVEKEAHTSAFYHDRTLWEKAYNKDKSAHKNGFKMPKRLKCYSEIYIGHTPTLNFHSDMPMEALNVWNVDSGAAFTGKLSALDVHSKQIFQSDSLMSLYPNEKGRNERSLNDILGKKI